MALIDIKNDAAAIRERILALDFTAYDIKQLGAVFKSELADNLLPLIDALVDSVNEDIVAHVDDLDEAVNELIDQTEDVLHPESAAQIIGTLEIGRVICNEMDILLANMKDEVRRKRIRQAVAAYRTGVVAVTEMVVNITIEEDEDEDVVQAANDEQDDDDRELDEAADDDAAAAGADEIAAAGEDE